jgi:L-fuculose-phosphate aldolase
MANEKQLVLQAAKDMLRMGLVEGTAGNISMRQEDGNIAITPSSVDYEAMTLDDICVIDLDANQIEGTRGASSEKLLHLACYKGFDDIHSVIHSHPIYATMFAVARQPIPACIDEFAIYVGGDVPVTDYAMSGTQDVGDNAVAVLKGRGAALIANHGMVAVGPSPSKCLHICALVERNAQIVWGARALGPIHHLPESVNATFESYYGFMRTAK